MTTPSNTKVHTGVTLLITLGRGRRGGRQNRPCVSGTHTPLFSVPYNAGVSLFLSLHHSIKSFENFLFPPPLQHSTQIKLFLGSKNNVATRVAGP
jgi:hypothetical protein